MQFANAQNTAINRFRRERQINIGCCSGASTRKATGAIMEGGTKPRFDWEVADTKATKFKLAHVPKHHHEHT